MAKKNILVATREIRGGTRGKGDVVTPAKLKAHEELTTERIKALGLEDADVEKLVNDGALIEVPAHVSDEGVEGNTAAVKAEKKRADDAETALAAANTKVGELEAKVAELTTQLEAAQAAAAPKS